MKTKVFLLVVLLVLQTLATMASATEIATGLSHNPVSLDESFQITFTAHDEPDGAPDFSPLEQDFTILHRNQGSNASWINGKASKTLQWQLMVRAKHTGNLSVPAIAFGSDLSNASSVAVVAGTDYSNHPDEDIFIEAEATPSTPFVQAQVLYTLRVFTRVEIARGELQEPELADAVVEKLGDDNTYSKQVNGVDYSVTERHYAIFPQKSGNASIKPVELKAEVLANNSYNINSFFNSQMTKTKRVHSQAITLNVQPVPSTFTSPHWLPAQDVQIKQQWSGDVAQMKVGEPLTRTLTLVVKGATNGQLPELNNAISHGALKAYSDQPVLQEQKSPDGLLSVREEKIALIPSEAGEYSLPSIAIPWFNTETKRLEIASLPAVKLSASGAATTNLPTPTAPPAVVQPAPAHESPNKPVISTAAINSSTPTAEAWLWPGLCAFFALGWLATLIYFLITRKPKNTVVVTDDIKSLPLQKLIKALKQACNSNDMYLAKAILLDWGEQQFGCNNLGMLAGCCEARLRDEILLLNQTLYGQNTVPWQGKKLFQCFSENNARAKLSEQEDKSLEPLYRL